MERQEKRVVFSESYTYKFDRYNFVVSHPHFNGSEYPEILLGQVAQYLYIELHPQVFPREWLKVCSNESRRLGQQQVDGGMRELRCRQTCHLATW